MMSFLSATSQTPAGTSDWREVAGDYFSERDAELQKRRWEGVEIGVTDYAKHEAIARQRLEDRKRTHFRSGFGKEQPEPFEGRIVMNPFNHFWGMNNLSHSKPKPTKPLRISDHIPSTPKKEVLENNVF